MAGHVKKRTYSNGTVKWRARYPDPKRGGTAQIERLFSTRTEAEGWLTKQRGDLLVGRHIDPRTGATRFGSLVEAWQAAWLDLEPKTRGGYESIINRHLLPEFGERRIGELTPTVVQAYVTVLAEERAPKTVRNVHAALRACLANAVRQGYLPSNPAAETRLPRAVKREMLFLTVPELERLADAMPRPEDRLAVLLLGYCGLRVGELWGLRVRDVDMLRGRLHVRQALKEVTAREAARVPASQRLGDTLILGPTKTHEERSVAVPGSLRDELAAHLAARGQPEGFAFLSPQGLPMRHGLWYRRTYKPGVVGLWPVEHGLHGLRAHDLRHTCASILVAGGANVKLVSKRLGHASVEITLDRYTHLFPDQDDDLAATLDDMRLAAPASPAANVVALRRADV